MIDVYKESTGEKIKQPGERKQIILVIDDIQRAGIRYRNCLIDHGYHAFWVPNEEEALCKLENITLDALLTDVHLTGTTSIGIVKYVRRVQPWSYIVCYSGVQGSSYIHEAEELCDRFLETPIDMQELLKIIEKGILRKETALMNWIRIKKGRNGLHSAGHQFVEDPNYQAYLQEKDELAKKHNGKYVAYIDGKREGIYPDKDSLFTKVSTESKRTDFFYIEITSEERIRRFRSPRKPK